MSMSIGIWLASQLTWRNTLRASGLVTMLYLIYTRQHPDELSLIACGAMMGIPSFIQFIPVEPAKDEKR